MPWERLSVDCVVTHGIQESRNRRHVLIVVGEIGIKMGKTEITISEYFDDRFYKIKVDDISHIIPSVSTKLSIEDKPFLYRYYAELGWDQARRKLHEAQDRGIRIHYAWYIYQSGGAVLYNPFNSPRFSEKEINDLKEKYQGRIAILQNQDEQVDIWKLQKFDEIVKPKYLYGEHKVYSIPRRIAGTLDGAIEIEAGEYSISGSRPLVFEKTGIWIFDLKTGNTIPNSAWPQISAYETAFREMGLGDPLGGLILHTSAKTRTGIEGFSCLKKTTEELKEPFSIFENLSKVWEVRNPNAGPRSFSFPNIITKELQ